MERKKYLECAIIINTHGVRGEVKLESLCDSPKVLAGLKRVFMRDGSTYREIKVLHASVFKAFVIAALEGVNDMDGAMKLKTTTLYAAREDFDLGEGDYFIADLIGLDVIDADSGKIYGKVSDMINRGASDIYVVDTPNGERMIPAVDEFIVEVDVNNGIKVRTIEGLLD